MSAWSNRRGMTLPLTILVIALISMAVAAGFTRGSSERRINANQQAQVDAFTVAQTGLEQYITSVSAMPNVTENTTLTGLPGGTAYITVRRVRDTTGGRDAIYIVESRGVNTTASRYDPSAPPAERTVAQYVTWQKGSMDLDAAFTSLSGVAKTGSSGTISGIDACTSPHRDSIPGVAVPNALYTGSGKYMEVIDGNPDDAPVYLGTAGTNGTAKDQVRIDWNAIVNQNALPAAYTLPSGSWPPASAMDEINEWPVVRVNGDFNLPSNGKGILIVTGDLTFNGNESWNGIVLVGGTFTSKGNNTILGALVSGLNIKLGTTVAQTSVGNGNKTIQYHSCNIMDAVKALGSLQRFRNAWMDNWPSY